MVGSCSSAGGGGGSLRSRSVRTLVVGDVVDDVVDVGDVVGDVVAVAVVADAVDVGDVVADAVVLVDAVSSSAILASCFVAVLLCPALVLIVSSVYRCRRSCPN